MKIENCLLVLILFFFTKTFACGYFVVNTTEYYNRANIVLKATVKKVHENETLDTDYYKIDIEPLEIFKGKKIESILVYGSVGKREEFKTSSCDMHVLKNTVWIFYISKDKNDNYKINLCSGSKRVDKNYSLNWNEKSKENLEKSIQLEFEILNFLKVKKPNLNKVIHSNQLQVYLDEKKGMNISNRFAFYQLTFKPNLRLKKIKPLREFDNKKVAREILKILKREKKWKVIHKADSKSNITYFIELYFYPEEKGSKSFISIYCL